MDTLFILNQALIFFVLIDPIGVIPILMGLTEEMNTSERRKYVFRELIWALVFLLVFLWFGNFLLKYFGIQETSLTLGGGIILFLIGLRMVFPPVEGLFGNQNHTRFLVPLAIPFMAGPSTLAILMLRGEQFPLLKPELTVAVLIAWVISLSILLLGTQIARWLGRDLLKAFEQLLGMFLTWVGVEMILVGARQFLQSLN